MVTLDFNSIDFLSINEYEFIVENIEEKNFAFYLYMHLIFFSMHKQGGTKLSIQLFRWEIIQ